MTEELEIYRRQIDSLDDQIVALLKDRLDVVKKVGEFKAKTAPDLCPIRPGREARMLRRMAKVFKDSHFSPAAAAQIWRVIIGTSTALEAKLTISVFSPGSNRDLWWLAREYFGPAATLIRQPHINRVIGDVMDGKASVGVIPPFAATDTEGGWRHLIQAKNGPKIFARMPFVHTSDEDARLMPAGLAFARLVPEASDGEDVSLFVLSVSHDISQHKLQTLLGAEDITAHWLGLTNDQPDMRHHVLQLDCFLTPESPAFQNIVKALGNALLSVHYLGSYAVPFTLSQSTAHE